MLKRISLKRLLVGQQKASQECELPGRKDERGQSFVEMALMLVFLLILLSVTVDLGWMFLTGVSLRESVQEAASYASICPTDTAGIRDRLRTSTSFPVNIVDLQDGDIAVCVIDPNSGACGGAVVEGNNVQVTVTYQHDIFTPFIGMFIASQTYPITVSAANQILEPNCPLN